MFSTAFWRSWRKIANEKPATMISIVTEVQALSHRTLLASSSGMSSPQRLLSICSASSGWRKEHKPTPRGDNRPNRHRDPWWSKLRAAKVLKVDVPDYEFQRRVALGKASPAEVRDELKKLGEAPLRERYSEKPLYVSCTGGVLDDYVPPEGDGKASVVSTEVSLLGYLSGSSALSLSYLSFIKE